MSFVESLTNVGIGYGVAVATQLAVYPMFNLTVSIGENLSIALIFTCVSIIRSYVLRRTFEWVRIVKECK
jgi:hypothetical protein